MALIKHGNNALSNVTAFPSAVPSGKPTLISTATASSSASIEFTSGIDSTYDIYKFEFINMHPATDGVNLQFQGSTNGGSSYGITLTSTSARAYHTEDGTGSAWNYQTDTDLAQSTSYQSISRTYGNGNDECASGYLFVFQPSSTTYVKHFIARVNLYSQADSSQDTYTAGYFNSTSALNAFNFKHSSGNIDAGIIKMYGISA